MVPALAQFEQQYGSKYKIVKINVDNRNSAEAQQYRQYMTSRYIPYTVVLKGGTLAFKQVGMMSVEQLLAACSK